MLSLVEAPAIRTRRKARNSEIDEARIIAQAIAHSRGMRRVLPVLNMLAPGSKPLGYTFDGYWCAYSSQDDVTAEMNAGKKRRMRWAKNWTGNPVAGNYYDMFTSAGVPVAATLAGAASTAVQFSDASPGSLYHGGNQSPDTKALVKAFPMATAGASPPTFFLYDRVLDYESCPIATSSTVMTNTLTAQRYNAGDPGLLCFATAQTATSATATALTTLTYVDQAGNTGHTMPTSPSVNLIVSAAAPSSINAARFVLPSTSGGSSPWSEALPLASGDQGMRSITNYTFSVANTGTLTFVLHQPLAECPCPMPIGTTGVLDFMQGLEDYPTIIDGACLAVYAFAPVATAANLFCTFTPGWS